ncbi:hypothetical protein CYCD_02750 [Tenuifilaceae bacterium CYCD]|nr:hypothetical protein CYCD_02750 [Tenuifilaceae bacterium CYCD]
MVVVALVVVSKLAMCQYQDESVFMPKLTGKLFAHNSSIVGNQFFLDNWYKGDIKLRNGIVLKDKDLNYNGYLDKFIWVNNNNLPVVLDDYFVSEVHINVNGQEDISFYRIPYKKDQNNDSTKIFAQLLSFNKVRLYAYRQVIKDRSVEVSNKNGTYQKTLVKYVPVYIFIFPDGRSINTSRLSSRRLINLFPENERKGIKLLLRNNNLDIRSEKDLIQFNEILSETFYK